jgi:type II secretory pathway pseudopilin PulG
MRASAWIHENLSRSRLSFVGWTQHLYEAWRQRAQQYAAYPCWARRSSFAQPTNTISQTGFSYVEVLVAMFILAIAIVPAMEAIQIGIQGAGIHQQTTQQHYALLTRMETVMAEAYGNLLTAAETAGNNSTASSFSDPAGQNDRLIVYLSLYDADANPFTVTDANTDGDNNIFTGDSADLLWIKVELENSSYAFDSLRQR